MTKTLTEQWKNGELLAGLYYFRKNDGLIYIEFHDDYRGFCTPAEYIKEVLSPVPDYEEYRELLDLNVYEKDRKKVMGLEDKVKRFQKRLKIATKALEVLETKSDKFDNSWSMQEQLDFIKAQCQETLYQLKEMEGVK